MPLACSWPFEVPVAPLPFADAIAISLRLRVCLGQRTRVPKHFPGVATNMVPRSTRSDKGTCYEYRKETCSLNPAYVGSLQTGGHDGNGHSLYCPAAPCNHAAAASSPPWSCPASRALTKELHPPTHHAQGTERVDIRSAGAHATEHAWLVTCVLKQRAYLRCLHACITTSAEAQESKLRTGPYFTQR